MKHDEVFHQFVWNYYLRILAFLASVNETYGTAKCLLQLEKPAGLY
jgi:hypothetical protein